LICIKRESEGGGGREDDMSRKGSSGAQERDDPPRPTRNLTPANFRMIERIESSRRTRIDGDRRRELVVLTAKRIECHHLVIRGLRLEDLFMGVQEFEAS
jgi:hypothetical protein